MSNLRTMHPRLAEEFNRHHVRGEYDEMKILISTTNYRPNCRPTFKEDNSSLTVLLDDKVEAVYLKNNPNGVKNASEWLRNETGNFDENVKIACTRFFTGYTDHDELKSFIMKYTKATNVWFNYKTDDTLIVSAVVNYGYDDEGDDVEETLFDIQF